MILPVVLVIVITVPLFSLLFYYLFRVYKRLQLRHLKPLPAPNALPPGLEQHQELAFVLAHGVEAYNQLRRQRLQREQAAAATAAAGGNDDAASIQSSQPSITAAAAIEPPPAYSAEPADGDVGYGWSTVAHANVFATPGMTGTHSSTIPHPLDNALPPIYIYQPPSARSTVQAALLTTDNSPSVNVASTQSSNSAQSGAVTNTSTARNTRRRSVVSGFLTRGGRGNNQRSMSMSSSASSSTASSSPAVPADASPEAEPSVTVETPPSRQKVHEPENAVVKEAANMILDISIDKKPRTRLILTFVLVTLASWTLLCHAAPAASQPRQGHGLIKSISPKEGRVYKVGDTITAKVRVIDHGLDNHTQIKLTFQRAIPRPDVNVVLAEVDLSKLSEGGYEFEVTKEHQGDLSRTNRYRIRYSFHDQKDQHHYVDSDVFSIARP
ncbi:hypothetical protein BGZ67_010676 [Mortierella alpina]|nr:hypothetical protein BGZ67_010676 [Mortierella alpina]